MHHFEPEKIYNIYFFLNFQGKVRAEITPVINEVRKFHILNSKLYGWEDMPKSLRLALLDLILGDNEYEKYGLAFNLLDLEFFNFETYRLPFGVALQFWGEKTSQIFFDEKGFFIKDFTHLRKNLRFKLLENDEKG